MTRPQRMLLPRCGYREKRTPADKGAWDFTEIRKANYFFQQVLPKYEAGSIKGDGVMIKHYIGEMYFCVPTSISINW